MRSFRGLGAVVKAWVGPAARTAGRTNGTGARAGAPKSGALHAYPTRASTPFGSSHLHRNGRTLLLDAVMTPTAPAVPLRLQRAITLRHSIGSTGRCAATASAGLRERFRKSGGAGRHRLQAKNASRGISGVVMGPTGGAGPCARPRRALWWRVIDVSNAKLCNH